MISLILDGRHMVNKKLLFGCWLLLAVACAALAGAQQPSLTDTQASILNAYQTIIDAYHAGADTPPLINQLNQALNLTQQAQQLQKTNPQKAEQLTSQAYIIAQNVTAQAEEAAKSAAVVNPTITVAAVASLLAVGVLTYALGPRLLWRLWFKLRRNYRIKPASQKPNEKALIVTPQQLCAAVLAVTIIIAFIAVSGALLPRGQGEEFSELGILGPNMKLGDYPSEIVASESVHLYVYVGNQMGQPMLYQVQLKLGDNNTAVNPANATALQLNQQVLGVNQTWTYPVDVTMKQQGVNQRLIFELWIYNQTTSQFQYHERWGQIWLNVTAPAT
jgi:hypothetical protein